MYFTSIIHQARKIAEGNGLNLELDGITGLEIQTANGITISYCECTTCDCKVSIRYAQKRYYMKEDT